MNESIWSCPFCSLLCEEHSMRSFKDEDLKNRTFKCPKTQKGLSGFTKRTINSQKPLFFGKIVDFDSAFSKASLMFKNSKNPIFCGLGVDVSGARSIVKLASKTNAIIDHEHGEVMSKTLRSLQTKGLFFTTLSEVKSRADLVVFVGKDTFKRKLCLYKNIVGESTKTYKKKIINYGDSFESSDELINSLRNLSAYQKNNNLIVPSSYNKEFSYNLSISSYVVLVWDPSCYINDADAIADILLEIIRDINKKTRGGILTLMGDEGGISMQSVMTWMTGLPLRSSFTTRGLRHDSNIFSTRKVISQNVSDLVIWVSCFSYKLPDYLIGLKCPLLIFGHYKISEKLLEKKIDNCIFIPVATPGVDVDGHMIRCDGVVTVPLKKIINSSLPSLQKVISNFL